MVQAVSPSNDPLSEESVIEVAVVVVLAQVRDTALCETQHALSRIKLALDHGTKEISLKTLVINAMSFYWENVCLLLCGEVHKVKFVIDILYNWAAQPNEMQGLNPSGILVQLANVDNESLLEFSQCQGHVPGLLTSGFIRKILVYPREYPTIHINLIVIIESLEEGVWCVIRSVEIGRQDLEVVPDF